MKLHKIRGGSEECLSNKEYRIGVGISLGSKWFTPENIVGLIEWSLKHTKDFVVVYVADSVHAINIEARGRKSLEKAKEVALKAGDEILKKVEILAKERFDSNDLSKIRYAKWDDLLTPEFQEKLVYLNKKYNTDDDFRSRIIGLVDGFTKNEDRIFSQEDKIKLGSYLIAEFPELLNRVPINNWIFDAYTYPFDGEVTKFVEDVQSGVVFPEIRDNIMDTEPKVFLEVRE